MKTPESVIFCECFARDGLQSMPIWVPTNEKIEMLNRIIDAGFPKLEVTSFSHPKLLPQFKDAEEVMKGIKRKEGVSYVVLMPNRKGFDRLLECQRQGYGADEIILMISASEGHNLLNFRLNHADAMAEHARIIQSAHKEGIKIIGCAGTVYGCPVQGDVPYKEVAKLVKFYLDEGSQTIMLGDTTGVANPVIVRERIARLMDDFPQAEFIAHFHDTRGTGIINSVVAIEMGVRYVDTSLGAIGGQPASGASKYHLGFTGNTSTEDLVCVLEEMGVKTGINLEQMIEAGHRAEAILDQRLRSNVIHSGPVLHEPSTPDKGPGTQIDSFK